MAAKFALVIGNSTYDDPNLGRLKAPDLDVRGLEDVLKAPDIGQFDEVMTLLNESCATVRRAIARFFERRRRDDLLLLYFSGHGVKDEQGHLYLALRDSEVALLAGSAIETAFITGRMDRCFSRQQVLVLDCCHSGALANGAKAAQGAHVGTVEAFEGTGVGRVILSATDATQYAWEGDRIIGNAETSLFTHFLIDGLNTGAADLNGNGEVTVDELYDYVRDRVVTATPRQTPRKWSYRQEGDVVIAQNPFAKTVKRPPQSERTEPPPVDTDADQTTLPGNRLKELETPVSDIFISYAHRDRHKARMLANALVAEGWSVWWDRNIAPGEAYDLVIERELAACKCAIVLWTARSVGATWVRNEARRAAKRQVLVPILMGAIEPPLEFENLQAADLTSWVPNVPHAEFDAVLSRIQALAPKTMHMARAAVENAMRDFSAGRTREAIRKLEEFRPPTPVVSEALEKLRAEAANREQARAEAAKHRDKSREALERSAEPEIESSGQPFTLFLKPEQLAEQSPPLHTFEGNVAPFPQKPSSTGSRGVQVAIVVVLALIVGLSVMSNRSLLSPDITNDSNRASPAPRSSAPAAASVLPSSRIDGGLLDLPAISENRPNRIAPADSGPAKRAAIDVDDLRARARSQRDEGDRAQALNTVVEGLRLYPKDAGLASVLNLLWTDAHAAAARQKLDAMNVDAEEQAQDAFSAGLQKEADAERLRRTGRTDSAIRALWAAADQFSAAAADARQVADSNAGDIRTPDLNQELPASAVEEALVMKTLRQYEAAYAALDVDAVRRVFPSAPIEQLTRDFAGYRSYSISIKAHEYRLFRSADLTLMNISATIIHVVSLKSGVTTSVERSQTIQLAKQAGVWLIRQIR